MFLPSHCKWLHSGFYHMQKMFDSSDLREKCVLCASATGSLFKSVRMGCVVYTSMSAVASNRWASAVFILVWMLNCLQLKNNALLFSQEFGCWHWDPSVLSSSLHLWDLRSLAEVSTKVNKSSKHSRMNLKNKCRGHIPPLPPKNIYFA